MRPGPELSPIVAGTWRLHTWGLDTAGVVRWVDEALDLGITTFDHADVYGGYTVEAMFGKALAASPGLRERLKLVTKCGIKTVSGERPSHGIKSYDSSCAHILASVDASLRALNTDRIDLLLIHRPDLLLDPDELADTFGHVGRAGKVLHFGVSNHSRTQLEMVHKRHPVVTNQIEFSPLNMTALVDGTLEQCVDLGLRLMIWSPLGGGRLFAPDDEQARRVRLVLEDLGARRGVSAATMAYAWIMRHPARPLPITGSGRREALRQAVGAMQIRLDREDWYRVWHASAGHDPP